MESAQDTGFGRLTVEGDRLVFRGERGLIVFGGLTFLFLGGLSLRAYAVDTSDWVFAGLGALCLAAGVATFGISNVVTLSRAEGYARVIRVWGRPFVSAYPLDSGARLPVFVNRFRKGLATYYFVMVAVRDRGREKSMAAVTCATEADAERAAALLRDRLFGGNVG